jgi:hypothetical protein
MEQLLQYTAQYGFPVVVSLFLLVRVDKSLSELTRAVDCVARICERWEREAERNARTEK